MAASQRQAHRVATHSLGYIYIVSVPFDRVIIGEVVTSDASIPHGYVAIRGETIAAIGEGVAPPAIETIDYSGKLIMPGLVDGHMHTSSSTGWPGIETATMSAA